MIIKKDTAENIDESPCVEKGYFLATLVALHFTPVSESLSRWAEFRTSVAWSLRACFQGQPLDLCWISERFL